MNLKYVFSLFWYIVWFVALPGVLAWQLVEILVNVKLFGFFEEFEFWHVLLLFALLAFCTYSLREKLPFWQIPDEMNPFRRRRRIKEARRLLLSVRKTMARKGDRVTKSGAAEIGRAMETLESSLKEGADSTITEATNALAESADKHLAFARKSASREYFESIGIAVLVAVILRLFVVEAFKIPSESMVPTLMVGDHIFVSKYRYGLSLPIVNTRLVRFAKPRHGEVIVFVKPPGTPQPMSLFQGDQEDMAGTDFIKRIIGLPGDRVEMKEDILYVNGQMIPRCRVGMSSFRTRVHFDDTWRDGQAELWIEKHGDYRYTIAETVNGYKDSFGPFEVPENRVFVLGDNRDNSNDSRYWGTVPIDNIKGRAMFIWWSNRRPHGFQWDRVGTIIMADPELSTEQQDALDRCPNMR